MSPHRADRADRDTAVRGVLEVLRWALAALVLALVLALVVVPRVLGGSALAVLSGSMEPRLSPGDVVVVRGVDDPAATTQVGDVVAFQPTSDDPTLVTHRVVAKKFATDVRGSSRAVTPTAPTTTPSNPYRFRVWSCTACRGSATPPCGRASAQGFSLPSEEPHCSVTPWSWCCGPSVGGRQPRPTGLRPDERPGPDAGPRDRRAPGNRPPCGAPTRAGTSREQVPRCCSWPSPPPRSPTPCGRQRPAWRPG